MQHFCSHKRNEMVKKDTEQATEADAIVPEDKLVDSTESPGPELLSSSRKKESTSICFSIKKLAATEPLNVGLKGELSDQATEVKYFIAF